MPPRPRSARVIHPGLLASLACVSAALVPAPASADTFESGSLIIPMDTASQDMGMFLAYGLVYELLRNKIPVHWAIAAGKNHDDVDFEADVEDFANQQGLGTTSYHGGPWIIDADHAGDAAVIVQSWLSDHPDVAVHQATAPFDATVARRLVAAPTLAMVADGNQKIARKYMQAAQIPDSILDMGWPDTSPDMLDPIELAGPSDVDHADGDLFDADGHPVYCQLMSMHWGVKDAQKNPEVVAEVRQFLNNPTHFFAECQAVNAFENLNPHGFFLTPNGFIIGDRPDAVDYYMQDSPYAQIHGAFGPVGGSEPSYTLPPGDSYKAGGITMMTAAGSPIGVEDVWMTGFLDGACPPDAPECGAFGKVSYLGGHEFDTAVPISANPNSQGARLFLNSLFEAPCATLDGLPSLNFAVAAPACVETAMATVKLVYTNTSDATALGASVHLPIPMGATFMAANLGGSQMGGEVVWDAGNIGPDESADLEATFSLAAPGAYDFSASLDYRVGLTPFGLTSNQVSVVWDDMGGCAAGGTGGDTAGGSGAATTSGTGGNSGSDGGGGASGGASSGPAGGSAGDTDSAGGTDTAGVGESVDGGCGCRARPGPQGAAPGLFLLAMLGLGRRRRAALALLCAAATGGCSGRGEEGPSPDSGITGTGGATSGGATSNQGSAGSGGATSGGGGPKFDVAAGGDTPGAGTGCNKIDFLFVIDSSGSMFDNQQNLIASFPGLVAAMQANVQADDWHVLVVDTDAQWNGTDCAQACSSLGTCADEPSFDCATPPPELCDIALGSGIVAPYGEGASNTVCMLPPNLRYADASVTDLDAVFSCVAQVGVDGADTERPMAAAAQATSMDLVAPGGCNAGFLRDDAILVLTIITDEPDTGSEGSPSELADQIIAAKGGNAEAAVVLGLLPDGDLANPLCGMEAVPAPRLAELLAKFPKNSRASVCAPDYSPFFEDAVSVISQACDDFVPPG